jgi:pentatricopeptide repeat protein
LSESLLHFSAWAKSDERDAVEQALSILGTMEEKGLQPTVHTYSSVIDAIAQRGEDPQQAEAILDRMAEAGVHPNVVTYSAVINGTFDCRLSMPQAACSYLFVGITLTFFSLGEV